jgi:hypothetical protein
VFRPVVGVVGEMKLAVRQVTVCADDG